MASKKLKERKDIGPEHKWDLSPLFDSDVAQQFAQGAGDLWGADEVLGWHPQITIV